MRGALLFLVPVIAAAQDRTISSDAEVRSLAFSKDGGTLAAACSDGKLRQWDVRSGSFRKAIARVNDESLAAMPSGSGLFAVSEKDGSIVLRDLESGADLHRIAVVGRRVRELAIANDRQSLAGSSRVAGNSREETMRLWDASGKERFAAPAGIGGTSALAISPDGSILAAGSWDTNLRAWNTRNGELLHLIDNDLLVALFDLAFTPDGKNLAGGGVDRTVYFWDTKTWKLARKFSGQPEMISSLAFSPDGKLLATGGFNDIAEKHPVSILLWDVESGKIVRTLAAPHMVSSVAFSPDGKLLAAASGDKTVRLWAVP